MSNKIRIVIVDDQALLRSSLAAFLKEYPFFDIVGEASNGRDLLDLLKKIETDIVVMDLEMPVMGGLEALKVIQHRFEDVKVVVLSVHEDVTHIRESLAAGARSYLSKYCTPEQLVDTLKNVHLKGFYLETGLHVTLFQNLLEVNTGNKKQLSKREREILRELHNGKTEKEIGISLNISRGTVHFHRMNIYSKTDTHNLAGLLKYASDNKLI